jgi:transposase
VSFCGNRFFAFFWVYDSFPVYSDEIQISINILFKLCGNEIRKYCESGVLNEYGRSVRYIANLLNIAKSTVHDALVRYRQTGQYNRRPGSGRKRFRNERDGRFLTLSVLRDRALTSNILASRLLEARGTQISARTVRRILHESDLSSQKPVACPKLTADHRVNRMRFAEDHTNWTIQQWSSVMFSDKSRFCLRSPDGRERVWRRPGE